MPACRIAVVGYGRERRPDAMLARVARRLQRRGLRVAGLLQAGEAGGGPRCATLVLEDIGSGERVQLFERRGAGARGCRLDPGGLAHAAGWLRRAIEERPDVLFVNRFGRQEAEGRGLLGEIAEAVVADIPLVVAVGEALLPDWEGFIGEATDRFADAETLEAWCLARCTGGLIPGAASTGAESALLP